MTTNYLARLAILLFLYVFTGKLGLLLAVPPGYATIIWPPSGIALGMLIIGGARLWPAVLAGSLLLNAYNSGVFADTEWFSARLFAAAAIAAGSTLQALFGHALIARVLGLPLRLNTVRDILLLLAIGGPLTCIIAASVGVAALAGLGIVPRADIAANWLAWWSGDLLGVCDIDAFVTQRLQTERPGLVVPEAADIRGTQTQTLQPDNRRRHLAAGSLGVIGQLDLRVELGVMRHLDQKIDRIRSEPDDIEFSIIY